MSQTLYGFYLSFSAERNGRLRRASMSLSDRPNRGRLTLVPPVILVMSVEARCARCGCRLTRVRTGPSSRRGCVTFGLCASSS